MKTTKIISMLGLLAMLGSAVACGAQGTTTNGTESTSSSVVAAGSTETMKPMHHGPRMEHGPEGLLHAALKEPINLTADQKTAIESALATLKPNKPPVDEAAREQHKAALVAAIRAGKIDVEALTPPKPANDVHAEHMAAVAKALGTLHATLTKDQRAQLVAAIEKKMEEHAPPKFDGAKEAHGPKGMKGPMHMFADLNLTQDQENAIKAAFEAKHPKVDEATMKARFEEMKKDRDAKLQSFVGDDFDANAFLAPPADAPKFEMKGDPMANELAVVVPVLTPAQREQLAQKIEAGPQHHGKEAKPQFE